MVDGITLGDTKMSVASAKAKTDEADYDKMQDEKKKEIYLRARTLFEYVHFLEGLVLLNI